MAICEATDFIFPMQADVYHPIVDQGAYGNVTKNWVLDRTIACNFNSVGTAAKEEVKPNIDMTMSKILLGRAKSDIRMSSLDARNSINNVIITNIRDQNGNEIYVETAGPRSGKSTIFEIATQEPYAGPFGNVEFYKLIIRRSENQAVDV